VDGISVGPVTSYTFSNVTANHSIAASFAISTRTITASAGPNGAIFPSGAVTVNHGASQTFTITPDLNYHVADVLVDGISMGPVTTCTIGSGTHDHTITASFAIDTRTITATAGANGAISPAGSITVAYGNNQTFNIKPDENYNIKTVLVDGSSVGPVSSYTFNTVTEDHTINASFVKNISIQTDKDQVTVPRGRTAPLQVKLAEKPQTNLVVTISWASGSPALSIQGQSSLTFTLFNWDTYQTVEIAASPDESDLNETAVFRLSGVDGLTEKLVTAIKSKTGADISAILMLLQDN
jgi:hypothetical protein